MPPPILQLSNGPEWFSAGVNAVLAFITLVGLIVTWIGLKKTSDHNQRTWDRTIALADVTIKRPTLGTMMCINTPFQSGDGQQVPGFYFRLPITVADVDARRVEVFATSLDRIENKAWAKVVNWIPTYFLWRDSAGPLSPGEAVLARLPRGSDRWCNFGAIVKPETNKGPILSLAVLDKGYINNHLLEPGKYRMRVEVTAENADACRWDLTFMVGSKWHDTLEGAATMLVFDDPKRV